MPLNKTEIRVPFGGGVDTKTDKKQVIPGKLLELKNGIFSDLKQITKRNGFLTPYADQTVDGDTISEGSAIYRRGKELLTTTRQTNTDTGRTSWADGWLVHSHGPDKDEWKTIGTREPLSLGVTTVQNATVQNSVPDIALADSNKYACYTWMQLSDPADIPNAYPTARASVIELANDNTLLDNWSFDVAPIAGKTVGGVHVIGFDATNSIFYVWIAVPDEADIYLAQINTATLSAAGAPVLKVTDLHADMVWDVCTATHSVHGLCSVVAYKDATGGMTVRWFAANGNQVFLYNGGTVIKNALTIYTEYDHLTTSNKVLGAYQVAATGFILGTTFNNDGTASVVDYSIMGVDYGEAKNMTGCKDEAADHYNWATRSYLRLYVEYRYEHLGIYTPTLAFIMQAQHQFDGTTPLTLNVMQRSCLAAKAWNHDGKPRVWVVHDSWGLVDTNKYTVPTQNTYFLRSPGGIGYGDEPFDRTDARLLAGAADSASLSQSISNVVSPAANVYLFTGMRKDVIIGPKTNNFFHAIVGATTKFEIIALPAVEHGPTTLTGGGFVGEADGRFAENNFHIYPSYLRGIVTVNGSSAVPANWNYIVVYEWVDREGQRHQSQPSLPLRVPLTGQVTNDDDHVTIRVGALPFGDVPRLREVRCVLYRTENNGTVYYRLPETIHRLNSLVSGTIDLFDGPGGGGTGPATADDVIVEREALYTTGGVIGNMCPPASSIMNVYQNRVMIVPDEDRTNIWFTKLKKHGIAVSFSDFFTKRIASGGDITALSAMDANEIVFKASEIRAFQGPGPNDLGEVGIFGDDFLVTSDVGCVDSESVVWTDKGIMFKSAKGIYILGRDLQVRYIGAPVEAYNQYRVIKATLVENKNQVRFLLESSDMLVYDYLVNQWSVFEHPQSGETHVDWDTVDSAIWQDNYVMIHEDSTVYQESTSYDDVVDSYIPLDLTTGWIKLNGLQGYQRVYWISLLGEVYGTCVINYEIYYDYIETNPQIGSVIVDATFAANPPAQFRIKPRYGNGKSQAFKLRLYDAAVAVPAGTQKGYSISDIMIQIGKKSGVMRQGTLKTK